MATGGSSIRLTASDETSGAFNSVRQSMASLQRQAGSVGTAFKTLTTGLRSFGGAIVGGLAINQIIQISDAYKNVETQLSNNVRTANELTTAQTRIFEIAQRTRQSYTQLATTYAQISGAAGSTIGTQAEQLAFFETLSKAISLSGASSEQASAALLQFRQGLAAGALRGEELNSVMEQTPRLARALAEGLGVGIGQLREMGAAGELTADRIVEAMGRVAPSIDAEFAKIVPTVEASMTKLGNSFGRFIDMVEKKTGGPILELGRLIGFLADQMDKLSAVKPLGDQINKLNQDIAKYEKAGAGNQFASAKAAELRAERDRLLQQSLQLFKEGERATEQVEFSKREVQTKRAAKAWEDYTKKLADNTEKAKAAAEEIRKLGEASGKTEAEIQKMIARSNAMFARGGPKKPKGEFADPLFDVIAGGEAREAARQKAAEDSFRALQQQEEAAARFEQSETDRLKRVAEQWQNATDATKKYADQYEEVMQAVALGPASGGLSQEQGALARFLIGNETDGLYASLDKAKVEMDQFAIEAARNIQDTLGQGLYDILDGNFSDIGKSFGNMIKRMVAEAMAADLGRFLLGDFGKTGSVGGILGGIFGLFGGARAGGGPVWPGSAFLVGEKGPELFVPSGAGHIVPNGAGGGIVIHQSISVGRDVSAADVYRVGQQTKFDTIAAIREATARGDTALLGA